MFFSVGLIHPATRVVPLLAGVAHEVMADVQIIHVVDEGIPLLLDEAGGITEPVIRRVCSYAINAQEAGADAVMLASPLIGPALDAVRSAVRVPAIRIDAAMIDTAVQFGTTVGVLATHDLTLDPTLALLRERADAARKDIQFETRLCEDAALALEAADYEAFDRIVLGEIPLLAGNDVIILADVLMHRIVHTAAERVSVPVLASPRHGFEDLARIMNYFRR